MRYLAEIGQLSQRRLHVRLVKGAYWDSEIKLAQIQGYRDYPVFTRKCNTDVSYLACMAELFKSKDIIYPMFATHNAYSIAAALSMANDFGADTESDFELQRLFGMGGSLFDYVLDKGLAKASMYAPVGPHKDLLPYLVRRLLENGANSSFVRQIMDKNTDIEEIIRDPVEKAAKNTNKSHPSIVLPVNIFPGRDNSMGLDLNDPYSSAETLSYIREYKNDFKSFSIISGENIDALQFLAGDSKECRGNSGKENFIDKKIEAAFSGALLSFESWSCANVDDRAAKIEYFADLLEENRDELMAICVHEAGKTIPDALAEVREAVDFCRYYAQTSRCDFSDKGIELKGYTGESNRITLHGRGVFVCISPWNFPLAIFTGQIAAALVAGNTVIAKPAEQTPYIASRAVKLMHKAGIPENVLQLIQGGGNIGRRIIENNNVGGVVFTGSTQTAKSIQRSLAAREGAIIPLIAETGGQNAMIVDSSALIEQVVDDVIISAFGSAGQRCSALRVLFVQDDIADQLINMLCGAMQCLKIGDPADLSTDIGPVIDDIALNKLKEHEIFLSGRKAKLIARAPIPDKLDKNGHYFAPVAYEIPSLDILKGEVFGPVLHIIRYKSGQIDKIVNQINATGYALTFGLHSRIGTRQEKIAAKIRAGNIYINRSMIGAVVGLQPFGGNGLSGTGPKAGGPYYLHAFACEKVVTNNTAAAGGNAGLVSLREED